MRKVSLPTACGFVLALLAGSIALAADPGKGVLDGRKFVGQTGEKGKTKTDQDVVQFAAGRFHSTACDRYGFGQAPYEATMSEDGTVDWKAQTTSPKEGKIEWKGTVKGDALEGTFVWTKSGQRPIEYWIKAAAQK